MITEKQIELLNINKIMQIGEYECDAGVVYKFYYFVYKDVLYYISFLFELYDPNSGKMQEFTINKKVSSIDGIDLAISEFKNFVKYLQK